MWGIDRLSTGELANTRRRLRTSSVAVLTQTAAVDRQGRPVLEALEALGIQPVRVFSPEHGLDGVAQAEEAVDGSHLSAAPSISPEISQEEESRSVEVVSLYGRDRQSLEPSASQLDGVDVLVIDLVDIGSRYYTYVWTALLAVRAAERAGVHVLVLDRPNPISGDPAAIEGAPQKADFLSFVGLEPLPIRHSMTLAEVLAHFLDREGKPLGRDGALSVVSPVGWERHRTAAAWRRPFVGPSPNMPTVECALVYPGGCLVEGTNLSEGRGTTLPFQGIGAPFLESRKLATALAEARLPGLMVRPHSFKPSFEKHAGKVCHGVALHVTDPDSFRPVTTYLTLIALAKAQAPEEFAFRTEPYEFETETPAFDLLTGGSEAREALDSGASADALVDLIAPVDPEWRRSVSGAEALVASARA